MWDHCAHGSGLVSRKTSFKKLLSGVAIDEYSQWFSRVVFVSVCSENHGSFCLSQATEGHMCPLGTTLSNNDIALL